MSINVRDWLEQAMAFELNQVKSKMTRPIENSF